MPTIDTFAPNSICWVDLAAKDISAAMTYYSDVMGWSPMEVPGDYHLLMNGEYPVGGAMQLTPEMAGMPPVWSIYVGVEDMDASIAKVTECGATVVQEPFDVPDNGRIAVILAPDNSALCLFQGGLTEGIKQMDEVGAPCWFDNRTRDPEAAKSFYEAAFGWTSEPMEGPMDYWVVHHNGQPMAGIMDITGMFGDEVPAHWGVSFSVADTDVAIEKTTAAGGSALSPAMDTPFGRSANLMDPWGSTFMVIDRSSATAG